MTMSDNQEEREVTLPEQLSPKECPGCPKVTKDFALTAWSLWHFLTHLAHFGGAENGPGRFLAGIPQSGEPVGMPVPVEISHSNAAESIPPRDTGERWSHGALMRQWCSRLVSGPGVILPSLHFKTEAPVLKTLFSGEIWGKEGHS